MKCAVLACDNHFGDGLFKGLLCMPCHMFISTGQGIYSQAYRNARSQFQIKPLTVEELKDKWNAQADQMNHWGTLGHDEMVEFSQAVHCIGGEE